jgi:uncharacterized protein (TIGR02246 family)
MEPEGHVVGRQVQAYNQRDVEAFAECYAPDAVIEDARGAVLLRGRDEIRAKYAAFFEASPTLHAEIPTRIEVGEYVIEEERISGTSDGEIHAVVVYHVADDLIDHVRLIGES